MPASSGDPISAALSHSLAASSKFSPDNESLDSKIIGSSKRVLLTEINYEQTSNYTHNFSNIKNKYIVLKPSSDVDSGEVKLKNGLSNVKEVSDESKVSDLPSPNSTQVCNTKPINPCIGGSKSDAVLPFPKKILFPPEKIQLGWQSKTVPIGSGMVNLGNTCYLNSTLQALFHVPSFVNWLLNDKAHKDKCETMNGLTHTECLICAMLKTLKSSMENSASPNNPIRPHLIYNKLKLICKRLMHGHQEDAHEFLRYLIESMDRSYLRIMQANNLDNYSKETTPLSQIFGGYLRTEVRCLECRHISLTFQHFQDLLLDIRQSSTLDEALEAYFSRERLGDGEEAYKCDKCHRRVAATKQFAVEKPPNVLCIQLKRFGIMGGKNSKHIQVQQNLDLTRFWVHRNLQPSSTFNYRLVSLVSHIGPSSNCGHYTAIGLTSSGQFYLFDDSMVRPVSSQSVSGNNTYIIMYELCSPNPVINGSCSKSVAGNCTVTKPSQPNNSTSSNSGTSSFTKSPSTPLVNGHSPSKPPQHSSPLKAILANTASTKISQSPTQASLKSLVPYLAESSDSETEPSTSKQKKSLAVMLVKNGLSKENSNCVKYSNCAAGIVPGKTSPPIVVCKSSVVNGWHVTPVVQHSPSEALCSPPQNWDVVDTSHSKNGERSPESSHKAVPTHNGVNGKEINRKPVVNGHSSSDGLPDEQKKLPNGSSEHSHVCNGKNWDGTRNTDTLQLLRKNSHLGYGSNVTTWNGSRTQVDKEVDNDRLHQRKRSYDQMYDDEYDEGKVKKMKFNNNYQKNGNRQMNGRRNFFQEHQNHRNTWYNRHSSFRPYNNNFRNYQNNNRNSNHRWRS